MRTQTICKCGESRPGKFYNGYKICIECVLKQRREEYRNRPKPEHEMSEAEIGAYLRDHPIDRENLRIGLLVAFSNYREQAVGF